MFSPDETKGIAELSRAVREQRPLVHCVTNYVTVNDCANALLAVGAAPVMADDSDEVADIAGLAQAVVLNIGTLNRRTLASMVMAGQRASAIGRPVVLDPVGAGASRLRTDAAWTLLREARVSVVRGNLSEIKALTGGHASTRGVDAAEEDVRTAGPQDAIKAATVLARQTGAAVAITGATDVVTDGRAAHTVAVHNGHPMLARITGSGCMLSAMVGAFCAAAPERIPDAVVAALGMMGVAGEQAAARAEREQAGTGSFRVWLMDALSQLDTAALAGGIRLERLA
ncbi:MAG TPA: hydroxyethylthiazole kinase [Kiritimatiellia bacterium]|nr:hydroxyethylthiazole kinase [Kiritimatiellia bacterium]